MRWARNRSVTTPTSPATSFGSSSLNRTVPITVPASAQGSNPEPIGDRIEPAGAGLHSALATPITGAFTYQGVLRKNGVPVNAVCTAGFGLFDAATGGAQIGPSVMSPTLQLVNELGRGAGADKVFARKLASVVVDQILRVLAGDSGQRISPDRLQLGRLNAVVDWVAKNLDKAITNAILAERAGLSEPHFRHMFAKAMGISPIRYVQQQRVERARELLANTNLPIAHLASECGFVSQSYLTTCFRTTYGMTPARFRRTGR